MIMFSALLFPSKRTRAQAWQQPKRRHGWLTARFASVLLCAPLLFGQAVVAKTNWLHNTPRVEHKQRTNKTDAALQTVALAALPAREQQVYQLIHQGGPFSYEKDGTVFANRERLLPARRRGFYREYTVAPPHAATRGARRIVCGGPSRTPHVCYHTADHYASFQRIIP